MVLKRAKYDSNGVKIAIFAAKIALIAQHLGVLSLL